MKTLSAPVLAALESRNIAIRDFLWIEARDRSTNAVTALGYWSDLGTVDYQVINPRTGGTVTRTFKGAGGLIDISAIVMSANLSVQTVTISVSQIADPNNVVRAYNLKFARVEVFRGLFAPGSLVQLAPAFPRFVGFIDSTPITTPAEGGDGQIELTCVGHSQEMSRVNTATRSDADCKNRNAGDNFYKHAAVAGTWELNWGKGMGNPSK